MILFKDNIMYKNVDLLCIFAPNATGKTIFAESFLNVGEDDFFVVNKASIRRIISRRIAEVTKAKDKGGFSLKLSSELRITETNIKIANTFLRHMGIKASGGLKSFNGIKLSKYRKTIKLENTTEDAIKIKLGISSSEFELTMFCLFYFSCVETGTKFIYDDPIEMASFENEWWFKEILKTNIQKIIFLTHRFELFQSVPSLHKMVTSMNCFFMLDSIPYKITSKSGTFFDIEVMKELVAGNKMFERDIREKIRGHVKMLPQANECFNRLFQECNEREIDSIGADKPITKDFEKNLFNQNLIKALISKRDLFNKLRKNIIKKYNNKMKKNVSVLNKVVISEMSKSNSNDHEIEFVFRALNASNHKSEWRLYNEINTMVILDLIETNINLQGDFGSIVKIARNALKNQKDALSSSLMDFAINDLKHLLVDADFKDIKTKRIYRFGLNDGTLERYDDNGGGQVPLEDIPDIIDNMVKLK